jgi:YbbR domain-containing protein
MKRNFFVNFFKPIFSFIDKFIIIPVTKFILSISKSFGGTGKNFEKFLSKKNNLLFISLALAFVAFVVIDQKIIYYSESSAEVLTNQPVKAIYNEEAYVIEGLPDSVDITLIGNRANLYIAKQSGTNDVTVDLTDLKAGTHKVEFKYNQGVSSVDYKVNPSFATVIIYNKVSFATTMNIDVLNQDKLNNKLVIDDISVADDSVVVKGAEKQIKKVASVKALLDVNNFSSHEVGQNLIKDVPLKAYDDEGNVIDVELVPSKVDVNVKISSPTKELPIKVIPVGSVSFGKAISSINMSDSKLTVYGSSDILDGLNYIPVEVDVNELSEDTEYKLEIQKPVGVKSMSVNNITVKVTLDNVSDKDISNVAIETRNLGSEYKVSAVSSDDSFITVNVKGVASVINSITSDNISAYVDLAGYSEGEHEVDVKVEGTDVRVQYVSKIKKVKVKISKK